MQLIPSSTKIGDDPQTLCLYADSVEINFATAYSHNSARHTDALLGQTWTARSGTACCYQNAEKKASNKEDTLVGQGFILQPDNDPKHQRKRTGQWFLMMEDQHGCGLG